MTKTKATRKADRRPSRHGGRRGGERVFDGLGVSPGIAIGPAHVSESGTVDVPEYAIPKGKLTAERKRLAAAVDLSRRQVAKLKAKAAVEEVGYLLDAYLQMLSNSRLVRGADRRIAEDRVNAESAVQAEISELARGFAAMDDAYLAGRIRDVRDVGARLVRNLTRKPYRAFSRLPKGAVIVADELSSRRHRVDGPGPGRRAGDHAGRGRRAHRDHGARLACRRSSGLPVWSGRSRPATR